VQVFKTMSIKRKQMLIIMLVAGIALVLACSGFGTYEVLTFRRTMVQKLTTLAEIVGDSAAVTLDFDDPKTAEETLAQLKAEPNITDAGIYDAHGKLFAAYERPGGGGAGVPKLQPSGYTFSRDRLVLFEPIDYRGVTVGTICIASDLEELYSRLSRYAVITGAVFLVSLLMAFLVAGRLQRFISEPILQLVQAANTVTRQKDYSARVVRHSEDEIGLLIDAFNEMLTQLEKRDATLQTAYGQLEQRVTERTQELASSLSLLHATLESTADAILVTDSTGVAGNWNERYTEMWKIPREVMNDRSGKARLQIALAQLQEPAGFIARIEDVQSRPEEESFDVLEFKDGRIFERYSKPQRIGDRCVGWVWSFRDITARRRAETDLRLKTAWLEAQLDSSCDGILMMDTEQRKVFQNRRVVDLWKVPKEIADDPDHEKQIQFAAGATKDYQKSLDHIHHVHAHPDATVKDEVELKDGTVLERNSYPIIGQDGTRYGRIWSFRDMTERKRAEADLARERDLLRTLLEHSPDYLYFKDTESRFLRGSQSLALRYGVDASELVGKTDFDLFSAEHARPAFEDEQRIMRTGQPVIGKIEKETWKKGEVSWVLTSKMPLRSRDGTIIGTFGISKDITAMKTAEAELEHAHRQLLETSRLAGMAEVATSVLHNVGNVLNSVNVSCSVVSDRVRKSKLGNVSKAAALIREHETDLADFLARDPRGRQLPAYLGDLAEHLLLEQRELLEELDHLSGNVDHIKQIVAMQQSYSKVSGVRETLPLVELVEDALQMNGAAMERHEIKVIRDFVNTPPVEVERHKVLQILINLLRNAKYACDEGGRQDKQITLRVWKNGGNTVNVSVADNGVGIPTENLTRVFEHGFTTRKEGHGFGLHSGALAAKDLRGSLTVASDGPGRGATFTLSLPCAAEQANI
jgi:PAS domain S-box-containing protein